MNIEYTYYLHLDILGYVEPIIVMFIYLRR